VATRWRTGKDQRGTFVEPFYSAEIARAGCASCSRGRGRRLRPRAARYLVRRQVPQGEPGRGGALSSPDYVAVTKYYLANITQAKSDLSQERIRATPLDIYLKNADWKRDPDARVDVASLEKLSRFMLEKLQWLEKPVKRPEMIDQSYLPADRCTTLIPPADSSDRQQLEFRTRRTSHQPTSISIATPELIIFAATRKKSGASETSKRNDDASDNF